MLERLNITWPLRQIKTMVEKGTIDFDLYFQRNDVWTVEQRSRLIETILDGYPIPPLYANKLTNTKVYNLEDGRQRVTTIVRFMNDEFCLVNGTIVHDESDDIIELSGKKYSDLSEEMKNTIRDYSMTVYYYEDMTDEQMLEMFDRLNSGSALSKYQKARASCPAIKELTALAKHHVFSTTMSYKAMNEMKNEHQVVKAYIMLNDPNPCLDLKYVEDVISKLVIYDDDISDLNAIFDKIYKAYTEIKNDKRDASLNKKIARRISTGTNFVSIIPLTHECILDGISDETYIEFLQLFFGAEGRTVSISDLYNENCKGSHKNNVHTRMIEIEKAWKEYYGKCVHNK